MKAEHKARYERMVSDLRRAKLKLTPQRLAILRDFAGDDSHPTAQDLFTRMHASFPTMSFATVYNTLDALEAAGLTGTLHLGGASRFDPNTGAHHHAICDLCGSIADIDTPESAEKTRGGAIAQAAPGFSVRTVERVYRGICGKCAVSAKRAARTRATSKSKKLTSSPAR